MYTVYILHVYMCWSSHTSAEGHSSRYSENLSLFFRKTLSTNQCLTVGPNTRNGCRASYHSVAGPLRAKRMITRHSTYMYWYSKQTLNLIQALTVQDVSKYITDVGKHTIKLGRSQSFSNMMIWGNHEYHCLHTQGKRLLIYTYIESKCFHSTPNTIHSFKQFCTQKSYKIQYVHVHTI